MDLASNCSIILLEVNTMQLIGLSGAARSGKDTVGKFLEEWHYFKRYAFADPLKKCASEMFGLPLETFYEGDREIINEFWGFSPRQMLQLLGTEGGREVFGYDLWTKRAQMEWDTHKEAITNSAKYVSGQHLQGHNGMVITDVRFENEAKFVKDQGGIILHIERPGADGSVGVSNHASEAGYPDELKDYTILNIAGIQELYATTEFALELLGVIQTA